MASAIAPPIMPRPIIPMRRFIFTSLQGRDASVCTIATRLLHCTRNSNLRTPNDAQPFHGCRELMMCNKYAAENPKHGSARTHDGGSSGDHRCSCYTVYPRQ